MASGGKKPPTDYGVTPPLGSYIPAIDETGGQRKVTNSRAVPDDYPPPPKGWRARWPKRLHGLETFDRKERGKPIRHSERMREPVQVTSPLPVTRPDVTEFIHQFLQHLGIIDQACAACGGMSDEGKAAAMTEAWKHASVIRDVYNHCVVLDGKRPQFYSRLCNLLHSIDRGRKTNWQDIDFIIYDVTRYNQELREDVNYWQDKLRHQQEQSRRQLETEQQMMQQAEQQHQLQQAERQDEEDMGQDLGFDR